MLPARHYQTQDQHDGRPWTISCPSAGRKAAASLQQLRPAQTQPSELTGTSMKHTVVRADFLIVFVATYILFGILIYVSDRPALWADETITVALVKSNSLSHLLEAVFLGLDATPPLYTSYGWFMSRYVLPSFEPDLILRVTNAALLSLAISAIYASIREYVGRLIALVCTLAFVLSQIPALKFLTFEVRTYALYLCCTAVAIHFALRASRRPSISNLFYLSIFYCLLTASHTFGIIYVVCISSSLVIASGVEGDLKLCKRFATATVPALIMFMGWVPVLRLQSQIPSWITAHLCGG